MSEHCSNCANKVSHKEGVYWDCSLATSDKENILLITMGKVGACPYHKIKS